MANELHTMRTIRQAMLERRLRLKAAAEGLLLFASIAIAFLLASDLKQALLYVLVTAGIGLPLFVARRGADFRRLARADDWRRQALEGRGITLAAWHGGASLPPWTDRR